jgi:hypothetical protein
MYLFPARGKTAAIVGAVALATVIVGGVPVMYGHNVSVTGTVWLPGLLKVKLLCEPVPPERVSVEEGKTACVVLLVRLTSPLYPMATLPSEASAVTVRVEETPAEIGWK